MPATDMQNYMFGARAKGLTRVEHHHVQVHAIHVVMGFTGPTKERQADEDSTDSGPDMQQS